MIKRTLYFGNPSYLKKSQSQLVIEYPSDISRESKTIPIEDVGLIVLDHARITVSQSLLAALIENNAAVLCCNSKHMPEGLFMPFAANHQYAEKLRHQLSASEPLKKSLWQQTIKDKIGNQYENLRRHGIKADNLLYWKKQVRSGDPDNYEGRAAAYYWKVVFGEDRPFKRWREGEPPNNLLNYGYAVLRAVVARSLVGSGMLPAVGIHHRNKYNPFCLADDVMEPYRPFVDELILKITEMYSEDDIMDMSKEVKSELLRIPTLDVVVDGQSSPLMVAVGRTTASLMQCFEGERRKILYPTPV